MSSKESKKKSESSGRFNPIPLAIIEEVKEESQSRITATVTLKGSAAEEFDSLASEANLNKSQLLKQMVYHCLGRTEELREFYRRLAILGK